MFSSDPFSGIVKYMVQVNKSTSSSDSLRLISDMIITIMIPLKDSHTGIRETVASLNSTGREVCNPKVRGCEENHFI